MLPSGFPEDQLPILSAGFKDKDLAPVWNKLVETKQFNAIKAVLSFKANPAALQSIPLKSTPEKALNAQAPTFSQITAYRSRDVALAAIEKILDLTVNAATGDRKGLSAAQRAIFAEGIYNVGHYLKTTELKPALFEGLMKEKFFGDPDPATVVGWVEDWIQKRSPAAEEKSRNDFIERAAEAPTYPSGEPIPTSPKLLAAAAVCEIPEEERPRNGENGLVWAVKILNKRHEAKEAKRREEKAKREQMFLKMTFEEMIVSVYQFKKIVDFFNCFGNKEERVGERICLSIYKTWRLRADELVEARKIKKTDASLLVSLWEKAALVKINDRAKHKQFKGLTRREIVDLIKAING